MAEYLFLYTIGPVQGYISQARKTIDLFAGSQMLSRLTKDALNKLLAEKDNYTVQIILPCLEEFELSSEVYPKIPNRILARVTSQNEDELKALAQKIIAHMNEKYIERFPSIFINNDAAKAQLNDFWEIYWLFWPISSNNDVDRTIEYLAAEKQLGSIKNIRAFKQITTSGETGSKCMVDGQRNALIYRNANELETFAIVGEVPNPIPKIPIWELSEGEGLSAPSFMKRVFLKEEEDMKTQIAKYKNEEAGLAHYFPSTARISLLHLINPVIDTLPYNEFFKAIKDKFKHSNDQLLYIDNLKGHSDLKELHSKLFPEVPGIMNNSFSKYYAMVSFDGDSMGKWFSGEQLLKEDKSKLFEFQALLSKQLSLFAKAAAQMIDGDNAVGTAKGRVVFAGEDFLAFVNIHYLFEIMNNLLDLWGKYITDVIFNTPINGRNIQKPKDGIMSFSAGILIAHYKEPLNWVLDQLRQTASLAKETKNSKHLDAHSKNRFCLRIIKHSGSDLHCTYPFWNKNNKRYLSNLDHVFTRLSNGEFSPNFIYRMERVLIPLSNASRNVIPYNLVESEINQSLKRACNVQDQILREIAIKEMSTNLLALLQSEGQKDQDLNLNNFIQMLSICDFMYRRTK